jgi:putative tryptophan/tyrosine transport system substrate-binding protein
MSDMRRREFITLLGGAVVAWPVAARAQQAAMPVVGFLTPVSQNEELLRGFRQGLKEAGFVEGENVSILYRSAENQIDRLPALADDLARRRVAVIATAGGPSSALAAQAATASIPVAFVTGDDPVRLGLVASLARPGGNLTGVSFLTVEVMAKRLELLRELVPGATRVALLVNPAEVPNTEVTLRDVGAAASGFGLKIEVLKADTGDEINAAGAARCPVRSGHAVLRCPACPGGPARGVPADSRDLSVAGFCRGRRADELRRQHRGRLSSARRLCRPHPQGRQARRPARRAVD